MKRYLLLAAFCLGMLQGYAQTISGYTFAASSGTFTALSGSTTVPPLLTDDVVSSAIDIGFDFFYMGQQYRYVYAGSDGFLSFNSNALLIDSNTTFQNNLNNGTANGRPLVAPIWDDLTAVSGSVASYQTSGTSPNRIFTFEWLNWGWDWNAASPVISFQVKLFENTGQVQFVYRPESGSLVNGSGGASMGITSTNTGNGNYMSLNGSGNNPAASTSSQTSNISAKPASGQTYSFTPPAPNGSFTSTLTFNNITSTAMRLNWTSNFNNEDGFAIYRSTDGTNYEYIASAATNATQYNASSLNPGTTYYWRVYAFTEGALSSALSGSQATSAGGVKLSNVTSGNWNTNGSWSPSGVPGAGDSVVIRNGHVITINTAAVCNALYVGAGTGNSVLQFQSNQTRSLTVTKEILISSTGTLRSATTGSRDQHTVTVGTSLTNNGTIDFSTNSNAAAAGLIFNNATTDQYFICAPGSTTNLHQTNGSNGGLHIDKGTTNNLKLIFTPGGTFTVNGGTTLGCLTLANGTFEITGSEAFSGPLWNAAAYTIPATGALKLNNANATITGLSGDVTLNGKLHIVAGTYNIGTATDQDLTGIISSSVLQVEGGSLNVAGRIELGQYSSYIQSAGTVTLPTQGVTDNGVAMFNITQTGSSFTMSGGTIILRNPVQAATHLEYHVSPTTFSVTGGTLQVGNAATTASSSFYIAGKTYNLTLFNVSGLKTYLTNSFFVTKDLALATDLYLNGQSLELNGLVTGSGNFVGTTTSNLTANGSGALGTIRFLTSNELLNNFTVNRTSSGTVTLGSKLTVSGALTLTNGKLIVGSNTLGLNGSFSGSAANSLSLNGSSIITIGGTGALGTLFFDQTTSGTTNRLTDLTYNRTGQTLTLGNALEVTGTVTPTAGILATGNVLKLVSNASGTARIAQGTGTYISGNVIVERYVQPVARRFRFLASNITNAKLEDWRGEIFITGAGTGTTIGTVNSNGFDATASSAPGVVVYQETNNKPSADSGWTYVTNNTSSLNNVSLTVGLGYRVFVRGDRSSLNRLDGTDATQNAVTMNLVGPVNTGNVTMPVSFTSSGTAAADGWCLLGNPYPSAIDWNTIHDAGRTGSGSNYSGTNYARLSPTIYIFDATSNTYKSYNAVSNTGTLTNGIIPSGSAFFVQTAAASPSLTLTESSKAATSPIGLFKTDPTNELKIKLSFDSITYDEGILKYVDAATRGYDSYDILKLNNPDVNISSYVSDSINLTLDSRPVPADMNDTFFLNVAVKRTADYIMDFSGIDGFNPHLNAYLVDRFEGKVTNLRDISSYTLRVDKSNALTEGRDRLMIVFAKDEPTGIDNIAADHGRKIFLHPAATDGPVTISASSFIKGAANISVVDVTGKQVASYHNMMWNSNQVQIDLSAHQQGLYFIVVTSNELSKPVVLRCIKQ